ncbi:MAG: glycoside hydrolase family 2 TIM barrel-domain containing protein, partial [bacterium]
SIANEPGIWGEQEALSPKAETYWKTLYNFVKQLDASRPVTMPTCSIWDDRDLGYQFCDFISINRYWGWYEIPGDIDKAAIKLKAELENLHKKYRKPIFVSELGADTIEGEHATYPQMFTEEYQVQLIQKYFEVIESLKYTVGEHIWNFADFRTAQHFRRVVLNKKGVFNRERQPKSAAFSVRKHWQKLKT